MSRHRMFLLMALCTGVVACTDPLVNDGFVASRLHGLVTAPDDSPVRGANVIMQIGVASSGACLGIGENGGTTVRTSIEGRFNEVVRGPDLAGRTHCMVVTVYPPDDSGLTSAQVDLPEVPFSRYRDRIPEVVVNVSLDSIY